MAKKQYDAILHVGDLAYNLDTVALQKQIVVQKKDANPFIINLSQQNNGHVGDEYMRKMESAVANVPYQTVVGNHEVYR